MEQLHHWHHVRTASNAVLIQLNCPAAHLLKWPLSNHTGQTNSDEWVKRAQARFEPPNASTPWRSRSETAYIITMRLWCPAMFRQGEMSPEDSPHDTTMRSRLTFKFWLYFTTCMCLYDYHWFFCFPGVSVSALILFEKSLSVFLDSARSALWQWQISDEDLWEHLMKWVQRRPTWTQIGFPSMRSKFGLLVAAV